MKRRTLFALLLTGCLSPPVVTPTITVAQSETTRILPPRDKVDILFMIDNSGSMEKKQAELRKRMPALIQQLRALGEDPKRRASYHIGVVTSDVGCPEPRTNILPGALVRGSECLPAGAHFIEYDQTHGTDNLAGKSVEDAFACLSDVGVGGCGIEQSLESVYRAVKNPPAQNDGFLRDDAILSVVFLTDEDDCSAEGAEFFKPGVNDPLSSYRCVARGYVCNPEQECTPATNAEKDPAKLVDLSRYKDLFAHAKPDPRDVVLINISAPPTPVTVRHVVQEAVVVYQDCDPMVSTCKTVVDHSCKNEALGLFGDPALRLDAVVKSAPLNRTTSICDDSYAPALEFLGQQIEAQLHGGCLSSALADVTRPDCVAYDWTYDENGHISNNVLIKHCSDTSGLPCFKVVTDEACPEVTNVDGTSGRYSIVIERDPAVARLPRTKVKIECATIAN